MGDTRPLPNRVPWWNTEFGQLEIEAVGKAISNRCISQGLLTAEFEERPRRPPWSQACRRGKQWQCSFVDGVDGP